jgi:hypothetical protein
LVILLLLLLLFLLVRSLHGVFEPLLSDRMCLLCPSDCGSCSLRARQGAQWLLRRLRVMLPGLVRQIAQLVGVQPSLVPRPRTDGQCASHDGAESGSITQRTEMSRGSGNNSPERRQPRQRRQRTKGGDEASLTRRQWRRDSDRSAQCSLFPRSSLLSLCRPPNESRLQRGISMAPRRLHAHTHAQQRRHVKETNSTDRKADESADRRRASSDAPAALPLTARAVFPFIQI